jgi:hypothetical protein
MNNELTFKALELVVYQTFSFCINSSDGVNKLIDDGVNNGMIDGVSDGVRVEIIKDEDGCDVEEDTELYQSIINFCKQCTLYSD